jgi:hypothetical protein
MPATPKNRRLPALRRCAFAITLAANLARMAAAGIHPPCQRADVADATSVRAAAARTVSGAEPRQPILSALADRGPAILLSCLALSAAGAAGAAGARAQAANGSLGAPSCQVPGAPRLTRRTLSGSSPDRRLEPCCRQPK